ncbi:hypothetical protein BDF19DRAFT_468479 [Syncephalis fuscata]|nr:hypothetical protein BDF19DRAFT_468479 [Syncephalis fuscata]
MLRNPRKIGPWCCIIIASSGVLAFIAPITFGVTTVPSCSTGLQHALAGLTISTMAINVILFERAYLAHQRSPWVLIAGIIAVAIPGPAYAFAIWYLVVPNISDSIGCYSMNRPLIPHIRFGLDLPSNVVFSAAFCIVVYRRYTKYHEACWKYLAHDGIIAMLLVIVSNTLCCVLNLISVVEEFGDMVYLVDWLITGTLLVEYQCKISFLLILLLK